MFPNKDRKEESIISPLLDSNLELGATSFVRIALKAFEMDMKYNYTGIDPTVGIITETQNNKIDKMAGWNKSPFTEYGITQVRTCYKLVSISKSMACSKCLVTM